MLVKRVRCHERTDVSGASRGDRGCAQLACCAHSTDGAPRVAWLAVSLPPTRLRPLSPLPDRFIAAEGSRLGEIPEPPTDPPRDRFVA